MAYHIPENIKYTAEHEWVKIEGEIASVGITDFAQSSLGDIVFVEVHQVGTQLKKGESFGVVESIKSVSDLYAPLSGEILEVNSTLENRPELCNSVPYDSWMIKIKLTDPNEILDLIPPEQYKDHCKEA